MVKGKFEQLPRMVLKGLTQTVHWGFTLSGLRWACERAAGLPNLLRARQDAILAHGGPTFHHGMKTRWAYLSRRLPLWLAPIAPLTYASWMVSALHSKNNIRAFKKRKWLAEPAA